MGRFRIPFTPKCHLVPCGHGQLPHTNPNNIPRCRRPAVGTGGGAASPPGLQLTHKTPWRVCGTRTCLKFAETVRISTIWCVKSVSVCNSWLPRPGRAPAGREGVLLPYNNYLDRPEATPSRQQPSRASSALQEPPKSAKASWVSKFRNIYDPHSVFTRQIIAFESIMYH